MAAATDLKADLLCVGTHGRTGLAHLLLGSQAERIIREAPCPVRHRQAAADMTVLLRAVERVYFPYGRLALTPELAAKRDRCSRSCANCPASRSRSAAASTARSSPRPRSSRSGDGRRRHGRQPERGAGRTRRRARDSPTLIGIRHVVVQTEEFDNPDYLKNDGTRCYHCKTELYSTVERAAARTRRAGRGRAARTSTTSATTAPV